MTSNERLTNYSPNAYQSIHAPPREIVTVFWDYENCPCPMNTKIAKLTKEIKLRIDSFLCKKLNKRIQLYCPMQRLHQRTRENATDLGILMMDVATKRKQESVDKRIIADIGLFAAELAESSGNDIGHIVLVSGDSDYGYILARLRDKSYIGKIIIFINDYTKETLTQHADYTHCLFQSNLTRKDNPFSEYNQRKIPPTQKISSYTPNNNHVYSQYSPSYNNSYHNLPSNPRDRDRDRGDPRHFQLNGHGTPLSQWHTTYPNFPYSNNNTNGIATPDIYTNGHGHVRGSSKPEHKSSSVYHHGMNGGSLNNPSIKNNKRNRSRSPHGPRFTQSTVKILKKGDSSNNVLNDNKSSNKASNKSSSSSGGTYVYRRKEHKDNNNKLDIKSPEMNGNTHNTHISHISSRDSNKISAPAPIPPPTPATLVKSTSSSSSSSSSKSNGQSSHRIVSQENLEEQLKQAQKEKRKISSPDTNINGYNHAAEIDGISYVNNKKNLSTFPVRSLYKINECNDEESKKKNKYKNQSPNLKPSKLDFNIDFKNNISNDNNKTLNNDFFTMIRPNEDDMDQFLKQLAPKVNVLHGNGKKLIFEPKTSHIIDIKQIRLNNSKSTNQAPKKILLKKKSTSAKTNGSNGSNGNNNKKAIADQLRLVWDALSYCQKNSNNTPRRREIYKAMKKMYPDFMKDKDQQFADECIDACLSYGTVEEMIRGRIQSLFILPVVLNALTSDDSSFKKHNNDDKHIWITLNQLKTHLKSRYTNHLSTYFTLTYLYRIISNPTRLFAFHKDDKKKNCEQLSDQQIGALRFRVRRGAYNNQQNQNHNNNYNNLTFNYYS